MQSYINTSKCNLFLFDKTHEANWIVPTDKGVQLLANQWADPNNKHILETNCYKTVSNDDRQPGDIVAFKRSNGSGHVCIASSNPEYCIGAGTSSGRVKETEIKKIERTTEGTTNWRDRKSVV